MNKRLNLISLHVSKIPIKETADKVYIVSEVNSFFCYTGSNLANKIEPGPYQLLDGNYIINKGNAELHFKAIGIQDIRDAITKHKNMRNSRIDAISCCVLQVALSYIEKAFAYLLNASIGASTFPIVPFIVELDDLVSFSAMIGTVELYYL